VQQNPFFLKAEISGQVTRDATLGRLHMVVGIAGTSVELLNDEGDVVATTVTDSRGRYSFNEFHETGDYQVRIVAADGMTVLSAETLNALVSRGDVRLANINFRVSLTDGVPTTPTGPHTPGRWQLPWRNHLAALDNAFGDQPVGRSGNVGGA
jgi:hypothetical protein